MESKLCCVLHTAATCSKCKRRLCEFCMNQECEDYTDLGPDRARECFCFHEEDPEDTFECIHCKFKGYKIL